MPPIRCPHCGEDTFTIAGWADLDRCANCGRPLGGRRFELQAARELSRWLRKGERDQPPSTPPR